MLRCIAWGGHNSDARHQLTRWEEFFSSAAGSIFRLFDLFAAAISAASRSSPWAHAVHHGVDHSAVADGGGAHLESSPRKASWAPQDHAMDALILTVILSVIQSFGVAQSLQVAGRGLSSARASGFVLADHHFADHRNGVHHVAGRADQRSGGVGNGMSLIIFTGIVVGLPRAIQNLYVNTFIIA